MRCSTLSLMGLVALLGIGLAAPRVLADQDQDKDLTQNNVSNFASLTALYTLGSIV
jgi:hypothetical protein